MLQQTDPQYSELIKNMMMKSENVREDFSLDLDVLYYSA